MGHMAYPLNYHFLSSSGVHLEPEAYHEKLGQGNTVVIDVRNNYEAEIGRFQKVRLARICGSGVVVVVRFFAFMPMFFFV